MIFITSYWPRAIVRIKISNNNNGCEVVVETSGEDVCEFIAAAGYFRICSRFGAAWERDATLLATRSTF